MALASRAQPHAQICVVEAPGGLHRNDIPCDRLLRLLVASVIEVSLRRLHDVSLSA